MSLILFCHFALFFFSSLINAFIVSFNLSTPANVRVCAVPSLTLLCHGKQLYLRISNTPGFMWHFLTSQMFLAVIQWREWGISVWRKDIALGELRGGCELQATYKSLGDLRAPSASLELESSWGTHFYLSFFLLVSPFTFFLVHRCQLTR